MNMNDFYEHLEIFIDYMIWIAPIVFLIGFLLDLYGEDIIEWIVELYQDLCWYLKNKMHRNEGKNK